MLERSSRTTLTAETFGENQDNMSISKTACTISPSTRLLMAVCKTKIWKTLDPLDLELQNLLTIITLVLIALAIPTDNLEAEVLESME